MLTFVSNGPTTVCANISTIPDLENFPIVEDPETFHVEFVPSGEVEILAPSNTTVYIIDEDGNA